MPNELLARVLTGAGSGVAWSLTGWGKSAGAKFDWFKFGRSVVIGGLVGVAGAFTGLPHENMLGVMTNYGVVAATENVLKTLFRRVFPKNMVATKVMK